MGQTLTHGVYLPDEGERNCYNGLASNWSILDGAVGTIAEHTTALAGKAPAVHTHTKADITDLFNSVNTWTASQTFTENSTFSNFITSKESAAISAGSYGKGIAFRDYQNNRLGYLQPHLTSDNEKRLVIGADSGKLALNSTTIPNANNSYDLGSSSYQWNNVYAKGYYYNGVAWGLDKNNQWTGVNDFNNLIGLNNAELWFKHPNIEDITVNPVSDTSKSILQIWNKGTTQYIGGLSDGLSTDGSHRITILCFGFPLNNYGGYYPHSFSFEAKRDGTASFYPGYTNASLGTSTNKWKSLNGINPGALSLPKVDGWSSGTELTAAVGVDTTNWDMSGGTWNEMTNNIQDGWVYFAFQGCAATDRAQVRYYGTNARYLSMTFNAYGSTGGGYYLYVAFPMAKGSTVNIAFVTSGSIMSKFIYPCLGNV